MSFRRVLEGCGTAVLVVALCLIVVLMLIAPATAQVVTAPASAHSTSVDLQPFLQELVELLAAAVLAVLTAVVPIIAGRIAQFFGLKSDSAVRDAMLRIAGYAVHYGLVFTGDKITTIKGIDVGDPRIATAVDFFLEHAKDEIAHFRLDDGDVLRIVQSMFARMKGQSFEIYDPPLKPKGVS